MQARLFTEHFTDVGFTGTQEGMTDAQGDVLMVLLHALAPGRLHHGMCVGADAQADAIAASLGSYKFVLHPPTKTDKVAKLDRDISNDEVREAKDYLARDEDIAKESTVLVATPKEFEEKRRSGTWATIRRGRKHCDYVVIIYPDGSWVVE